jgi:energy-coupling factor transporter ATP-binding protein EcfA2
MVDPHPTSYDPETDPNAVRIRSFSIEGLFGGRSHLISFPEFAGTRAAPNLLILSGQNGSGKTTILRMVSGMLDLDFDMFRQMPFVKASLNLSNGDVLSVASRADDKLPLQVEFRDCKAVLPKNKLGNVLTPDQDLARENFRTTALPILNGINFELLDIHRSSALRAESAVMLDGISPSTLAWLEASNSLQTLKRTKLSEKNTNDASTLLSNRVRVFMREAQVNYRKFFSADDLELLPRILERFQSSSKAPDGNELLNRVLKVQGEYDLMKRFGLQTDDADLTTLSDLLQNGRYNDAHSLNLLESYVEIQENENKARNLIAARLLEFESIMDEFNPDRCSRRVEHQDK